MVVHLVAFLVGKQVAVMLATVAAVIVAVAAHANAELQKFVEGNVVDDHVVDHANTLE